MNRKQAVALIHVGVLTVYGLFIAWSIGSIAMSICDTREQTDAIHQLPHFRNICIDLINTQVACFFPLLIFWPAFYNLPSTRDVWVSCIMTSALMSSTMAFKFWNPNHE